MVGAGAAAAFLEVLSWRCRAARLLPSNAASLAAVIEGCLDTALEATLEAG